MGKVVTIDLNDEEEARLSKIVAYFGVRFDTEGIRLALKLAEKRVDGGPS